MIRYCSVVWQLTLVATACALLVPVKAQERMVVHVDDVYRMTCPSTECGVIGRFYFGESVPVHESLNGWSRVSGYYSAGCHDGRSAFVERGPSACTEANGIVGGEFAEWIRSDSLARGAEG